MTYPVRKTLTNRQWKIVIDVIKDAIFELDTYIKKASCSDNANINCDRYIGSLKESKAKYEEILTELE